MLTFEYTFEHANDEVYFAYALPYTFSKCHNLVKEIMNDHKAHVNKLEQTDQKTEPVDFEESKSPKQKVTAQLPASYSNHAFIRECRFCYSLSGLEVPELTITS